MLRSFLKKFEETGSLSRHSGSGRPSKITADIKEIVENPMQHGGEATAVQLHCLLNDIEDHSKVQDVLRMDFSWQCLLSNDPRRQQGEKKTGMGT